MIDYRLHTPLAAADIARLFDASGIKRPTGDLSRIARMFANANLVVSAWSGEQLVGVCRALTDFSYCCYLSDLAVDQAFQHQGIGRELVARVQAAVGDEVSIVLLSAPDALNYYPKLGFEKLDNGFVLRRRR
ncbi:MAG: GNAT family N-acetyltransferase [Proteobacteria bacterium]|nr:GNAT family N-acetyltransferase [Pseudomonadota bacterium]RTL39550.1 MAG: GNAT family N-acetyltransferase [Rhodocyclaceae bacterium]